MVGYDEEPKLKPQKTTLLNSINKLRIKVDSLEELANMSDDMIIKFEQTQDKPAENKKEMSGVDKRSFNLIEMIDIQIERMDNYMDNINKNVSNINDIIG